MGQWYFDHETGEMIAATGHSPYRKQKENILESIPDETPEEDREALENAIDEGLSSLAGIIEEQSEKIRELSKKVETAEARTKKWRRRSWLWRIIAFILGLGTGLIPVFLP